MVYQEFTLAPDLSVAENLSLGREPGHRGIIARGEENASAEDLLQRVHLDVEPKRKVSRLTVAEQQRVEIAKALAINAKVLIMDEPTSTLTGKEIDDLFEIIEKLKSDGIAILYITHKLDEIFRIADRITVMRDAEVVDTLPANELDEDKLISLMVGREVENLYPKAEVEIGEVILTAHPGLDGIFAANEGGVLGAAEAVRRADKTGEIAMVGWDASPDEIAALKEGVVSVLVTQNPFKIGYEGVNAALQLIRTGKTPKSEETGTYYITKDNVDDPKIKAVYEPSCQDPPLFDD